MRTRSYLPPLALALALLPPAAHGTPGFLSPFLAFDAGPEPSAIAVADFDEDGQPDLALSNRASNQVSVLRGLADLDYALPIAWPVGAGPAWVVAGDINDDGHVDLVTADVAGSTLSLLLGDGTGAFVALAPLAVPSAPRVVAIGDLDGDGRADLVSCGPAADSIYVHRGIGGGAFAPASAVATGPEPAHIGLGDLDQDSRPDVVVALRGATQLAVHRGLADGTLAPREILYLSGHAWSVVVTDLNLDGWTDVLAACPIEGRFSVLMGDGPMSFFPRSDYFVAITGTGALWMAVADFDGDGDSDVAVANSFCPVTFFRVDGTGSLTAVLTHPSGNGRGPIVAARLDGDRFADLAMPGAAGTAHVAFNPGGSGLGAGTAAGMGRNAHAFRISDLDGDGNVDLAVSRYDGLYVRLGHGDGTFAPGILYAGNSGLDLALADVDRSGRPDAVLVNYDGVTTWRNAGDGTFLAQQPSAVGPWCTVEAGELNGDAYVDLAAGNCAGPYVYPLVGDGAGNFTAQPYVTLPGVSANQRVDAIALGDFNGDDALDIAAVCGGVCFVLIQQESYFTGANAVASNVSGALAAADLDADGKLDLVVGDLVLIGSGGGTFTAGPHTGVFAHSGLAVADVNGDGHLDIVAADDRADCVAVALGGGTGAFTPEGKYGTGYGPGDVFVADENRDGRQDILALNTGLCGPSDVNTVAVLHHAGVLLEAPDPGPAVDLSVAITPNPVFDRLDLAIGTPGAGTVSVRITDLAGRTLYRRSLEVGAGPVHLMWDLRLDGGLRVAPGVCFYEVRTVTARRTGRFVVTY